ncbi:MAG: hypothetical protein GY940_16295 [bacterium]|nr:hypothetical protein [bacterium]
MAMFKIKNQSERLVILRLNSGKSLFLESGSLSGELAGEEVGNNRMVNKLTDRKIIEMREWLKKETHSPAARDVKEVKELKDETPTATKKTKKTKPSSKGGK